jgi:hypothetical protein
MKNFAAILALTALLLVLLWGLIFGLGTAEPLVPDPESVTQSFLSALSAGRYEIARQELSDELKGAVTAEALQQLDEALKQQYGGYDMQPGGQTEQQDAQATYQAQIETESGQTLQPTFELARDAQTGLWQITSFKELGP